MANTEINIITFNNSYKGKPCNIWNKLYELSLYENDYFLQVGSDIEFIDANWCECMINILKENDNLGVVGLTDIGRKRYDINDTLLTQTMVSKKHYDIFIVCCCETHTCFHIFSHHRNMSSCMIKFMF